MNALHPGVFTEDWVNLDGVLVIGYRSCIEGMIRSLNVLLKKELKQFKFCSESRLFRRLVKI